MDGVVQATYGGSAINTTIQLFKNIRVWGSVFVGLMVLIAVFLIRNTIKNDNFSTKKMRLRSCEQLVPITGIFLYRLY